jgi:hypothetical protein
MSGIYVSSDQLLREKIIGLLVEAAFLMGQTSAEAHALVAACLAVSKMAELDNDERTRTIAEGMIERARTEKGSRA